MADTGRAVLRSAPGGRQPHRPNDRRTHRRPPGRVRPRAPSPRRRRAVHARIHRPDGGGGRAGQPHGRPARDAADRRPRSGGGSGRTRHTGHPGRRRRAAVRRCTDHGPRPDRIPGGRVPTTAPPPPTGRTDVDNPGPGAPATGGMPTESPAGGFPAAARGQAPATAPSTGPTPAAPDGVDGPTASTRTLLSPRMRSAHRSGVGWWHPPKARPRVDGARHRAAEGERSGRTTRRRRIRLVLLGLAATASARPGAGLRRRVRRLPRPHAGRRGEQPGRAALLRRRRPAHPARARAGQPHEGADPGRAGARARGRARRRGPQLLLEPRLRPDRHRARRVEPDPRRRRQAAPRSPSSTSRTPSSATRPRCGASTRS